MVGAIGLWSTKSTAYLLTWSLSLTTDSATC